MTVPVPTPGVTRSFTIDRDSILISASATVSGANGCVLTSDPSLTAATLLAAPAAGSSITGDIAVLMTAQSNSFSQNLQIPLLNGQVLYLNSSVGTWVFLLLEDAIFPA